MSEEQLQAFIAKVKDDQSIQDKLKAVKTPEEFLGIAKEHGYEFTIDVLKNTKVKLSEDELEGVAGGGTSMAVTWTICGFFKNHGC